MHKSEVSVAAGLELFGNQKGGKFDLLSDQPQSHSEPFGKEAWVGRETVQRDRFNGSVGFGVQVGIGGGVYLNWDAVKDIGERAQSVKVTNRTTYGCAKIGC